MAHDTRSANLSITHDPAFQPSRTNATRYRLDPANATSKPHSPHYQATRHTIRFTIYNATLTAHGSQAWQDIAQRTGQAWHSASLRNLFLYGRLDGITPLPHDAQLAQLQMRKTPLNRKTPPLCRVASSQKNSLFLPLLPYAATLTPVNKML